MKPASSPQFNSRDAFTFVEVFAALIFLAILVPAIVEALSIANKASVIAERSSVAGELAENKLNEILLSSTSQNTSATGQSGDFGTDYPGYRWEESKQNWNQDNINVVSQLSVDVYYQVQGQERSFTLTTLLSGSSQATGSSL